MEESIQYLLEAIEIKVERGRCSKILYFAIKKTLELPPFLVLTNFFELVIQSNGKDAEDYEKITKIIEKWMDHYKRMDQLLGVKSTQQTSCEELEVAVNNYYNSLQS